MLRHRKGSTGLGVRAAVDSDSKVREVRKVKGNPRNIQSYPRRAHGSNTESKEGTNPLELRSERNFEQKLSSDASCSRVILQDLPEKLSLAGNSREDAWCIIQRYFNHIWIMSASDAFQWGIERCAINPSIPRVRTGSSKPFRHCKRVSPNGVRPASRDVFVKTGE